MAALLVQVERVVTHFHLSLVGLLVLEGWIGLVVWGL